MNEIFLTWCALTYRKPKLLDSKFITISLKQITISQNYFATSRNISILKPNHA